MSSSEEVVSGSGSEYVTEYITEEEVEEEVEEDGDEGMVTVTGKMEMLN